MVVTAAAELKRPSSGRRTRPACRNFGGDAKSLALAVRIAAHGRALAARTSTLFVLIAEYDETEAWRGDGAVSMPAWMVQSLQISPGTA
ncbi:MAG TPA: hypothetical protein VHV57_08555, partial [Acidimicrobiales bacterium]|nr:hypothetical protein [Acidimicrobiales bacterium]